MMSRVFKWILSDKKERMIFIAISAILFCLSLYFAANHFTMHLYNHLLPLSVIDRFMPFIPVSIWIYISYIPLCLGSAYLVIDDVDRFYLLLYAQFCYTLVACLIFLLYPTVYPRSMFPLPMHLDHLTYKVFTMVRQIDFATTCLPSTHVGYCSIATLIFYKKEKNKFFFFLGWALLVIISTLTTKQHYLLDILSGFCLAVVIYSLLNFHMTKKLVPQ